MDTTTQPEPLRPGPAPAGQPAWIYFECNKNGIYFEDGADATVPHQWLPAPSAPPMPPAEKTVEELDLEHAGKIEQNGKFYRETLRQCIFDGIRYGREDAVRRFARELLKTHSRPVQEMGKTLIEAVEEAAK